MKAFIAAACVLVLTASVGVAQGRLSVSAVIAAVEAKGFTVIELDDEGGWLEVEATNAEGRRVELRVDAATGEIIREGVDD